MAILPPDTFTHKMRVYYNDTDAGGVVYHANYLVFAESARAEWLREKGFSNKGLIEENGILFALRKATADYLLPAFLEDYLGVTCTLSAMGGASMTVHHQVLRLAGHNGDHIKDGTPPEVLCEMDIVLVCVDCKTFRPTRIPDSIKAAFTV